MKPIKSGWKTSLVMVALAAVAQMPNPVHAFNSCAAGGPPHDGPMPPGPGMFQDGRQPGLMPPLPYLRGLELSEAQHDKVFELMLAQAGTERARTREAFKAMDELRRLASADRFDGDKARGLAEAHARAVAQLLLMRAELEAKLRALLTPEQRKQLESAAARAESHRAAARKP